MLLVFRKLQDRFSNIVILSISIILWTTRVILQLVYPQGSQNSIIQYSMLLIFWVVLACFALSVLLILRNKEIAETR
jgi:hypothetical protein